MTKKEATTAEVLETFAAKLRDYQETQTEEGGDGAKEHYASHAAENVEQLAVLLRRDEAAAEATEEE